MQKILLATKNKGKIAEIGEFLKDLPVKLLSLKDVGIDEDVVEDGITYEENSKKKALFYAKLSGLPVVSDDGGLEISFLNGAPGVKSRRWLGYEGTDEELLGHLQKVSDQMGDDGNRRAKFVTVVTFAVPDGKFWSKRGEVDGIIAKVPHIKLLHGYPYRSFFFLPEINKYYHENELTSDETRTYNHRWKAIDELKSIIRKELKI